MEPKGKQPTILFLPLSSAGHINTSLALADRLSELYNYRCVFTVIGSLPINCIKDHGHLLIELDEINSTSDKKSEYENFIKDVVEILKSNNNEHPQDPWAMVGKLAESLKHSYTSKYRLNCHQYERIVLEYQPELIFIDNLIAPPVVIRESHKYPWVRIQTANPHPLLKPRLPDKIIPASFMGSQLMSKQERKEIQEQDPMRWQSITQEWKLQRDYVLKMMDGAFKEIYDYYESIGLGYAFKSDPQKVSVLKVTDSPYLNIYLYPEVLDYVEDDDLFEYPKLYLRCDSIMRNSLPNKADQDHWMRLIAEKSVDKKARVLFSLGSIVSAVPGLVKRFVDILSQDQKRLYIVSKGRGNSKLQLDEANMIGDEYIPQPFLLQHVDLAIVHGGNNGITECLHYGVPVIVMPLFFDQFDNAQRVVDKKVGKRLSAYSCTQQELFDAIDDLLSDQSIRKRVQIIGEKMRARDDLNRVAKLLHSLAQDKKLTDNLLDEHNISR